jgi:GTP diphosphokinase / guanosine-3',5'-bis(diphosphate) 3'-diphosphatase
VYADIGRGALRADEVLEAVYPELKRSAARTRYGGASTSGGERPVSIEGLTEGIAYRLGGCCHPIPGDRIIGLMVPGEGVIVHAVDCEVLDRHQDSMIDWMDVHWRDRKEDSAYSVARISVRVENMAGSLASIANIISRNGANISNLKITNRNPLYFELQIDLEVRDTQHLEHIIRALKVDSAVEMVERARGLDTDGQEGAPLIVAADTQGVLI